MNATLETPGARLRHRRRELGLTALELSALVGRCESAVRNHENGTNGFPTEVAKSYGAALQVSPSWLLFGDAA